MTPAHTEAWQALRIEGARDFPLGFLVTREEAEAAPPQRCRRILAAGTSRGVFDGGRLIGFCGLRREHLERTRHRAEIGPFFVTASYHGSGAASVLMQGVMTEAAAEGIEQLELFVDTGNLRALAFYERQGFQRIARHPDGLRISGAPRDAWFCILQLLS